MCDQSASVVISGGGRSIHGVEFAGDLFAGLAAGFATDDINRGAAGDLVKPGGENGVGREAVRLAGEVGEGGLGDFLGQLRGADLAQRGGKDQIEVAADNFGESILGVLPGISRKQLQVTIAHLHKYIAAGVNTGQKEAAGLLDAVTMDRPGSEGIAENPAARAQTAIFAQHLHLLFAG